MNNPKCYFNHPVRGDISSTMLFSSFHASATYLCNHHIISVLLLNAENVAHFVWLPLATNSFFPFKNLILVYAKVFPNLSQVTSARSVSPTLPPEFKYVTLRSVETPVAKSPLEATAKEPPRSTHDLSVEAVGRTWEGIYPCLQLFHHGGCRDGSWKTQVSRIILDE